MNYIDCTICEETFIDPTRLDIHMKIKHKESEYDKHERKLRIVRINSIKKKDTKQRSKTHEESTQYKLKCDYCDLKAEDLASLTDHIKKHHSEALKESYEASGLDVVKVELEDDDEESDFFDMEFIPKNCTIEEVTGVLFKGESTEFKEASKRLSEMMSKVKAKYVIEGREVKTLSVPKAAPTTIEVKTIKGKVGRAGIKFFTSKTNTIMVTKQKGQENIFVKALALKVVKKMLIGLISGEMSEDTLRNLTIEYKCNFCEKVFYTKQGANNHMKRSHDEPKSDKQEKAIKEEDFVGKRKREILKHCEICDFSSSSEDALTKHASSHQKQKIDNIIRKCDECDLEFNVRTQLEWIKAVQKHKVTTCTAKKTETSPDKSCKTCDYQSMNEDDFRRHMRDTHEVDSISNSPPSKKRNKRTDVVEDEMEVEENKVTDEHLIKDMDKLLLENESPMEEVESEESKYFNEKVKKKVNHNQKMNIKKHEEREQKLKKITAEKDEMVNRSKLMDIKVKELQEKREKEEKLSEIILIESNKKLANKREEEASRAKKETKMKHNNQRKQRKANKVKEKMRADGYIEIDIKYHHLVGKHRYRFGVLGDGACQSRGEAKTLFHNQDMGPKLATLKNAYLVDHWDVYGQEINFPHTIIEGSRKRIIFNTKDKFHEYLLSNPHSSHMWADHIQLQITANMFNVTTKLLVTSGEGALLTFVPDERLTKYAVLPFSVDTPEVWLMYNGYHYDTLVAEDSTVVTFKQGVEEDETDEEELVEKLDDEVKENVQLVETAGKSLPLLGSWINGPPGKIPTKEKLAKCDYCQFCFMNQDALEEHQKDTGHKGFWERDPDESQKTTVVEKDNTNDLEDEENKDKIITSLRMKIKLLEESKRRMEIDHKAKLKNSEESKKKMEIDHRAAMKEVGEIKEKEVKLRIQNKSLLEYRNLMETKSIPKNIPTLTCAECEYNCSSEMQMKEHMKEHLGCKIKCRKCNVEFETESVFQDHMNAKHRQETNKKNYNCPECYFQSSLKEELDNHITIKHTVRGVLPNLNVEPEKIKCRTCGETFENMWRLKNHRRDQHPHLRRPCLYDLEDRCNHSDNVCWYRHKETNKQNISKNVRNSNKCFTCQDEFETMNNLMIHRKQQHPEQCKTCVKFAKKECKRSNECWFIHKNTEDFQESQNNLAPPSTHLRKRSNSNQY